MMQTTLRGPAFSPWNRYKLLAHALRDVAPEHAASTTRLLFDTCRIVIAHATGKASYAAADDAVERARVVTQTARLGALQPAERAAAVAA